MCVCVVEWNRWILTVAVAVAATVCRWPLVVSRFVVDFGCFLLLSESAAIGKRFHMFPFVFVHLVMERNVCCL